MKSRRFKLYGGDTSRDILVNNNAAPYSESMPIKVHWSGIPVIDKSPFLLPAYNSKRNTDRFMQITVVLRQYAEILIPREETLLVLHISQLFGYLDTSFNKSPFFMATHSAVLLNWFKVFVLSGSREQGDIADGMWSQKLRAPVNLAYIVEFLDTTMNVTLRVALARLVLSMLSVYKVLTIPVMPSLSPITDKFSGSDIDASFIKFKEVFSALGINPSEVQEQFKNVNASHHFHESMAAGPNGHAVWAAHLDAYELANDLSLMKTLRDLARRMGLRHVNESLDNVLGIFAAVDTQSMDFTGGSHSKLHVLYEKGTKARVIAIGDYYSQNVLSPFHEILANILKAIPMDSTFNQEAGFERVRVLSMSSDELHSLDLSKATDRLPRAAQVKMMAALLGDAKIASLWGSLIGDRTFWTETGHKVCYSVGQPQGFKSSFPAMALLHHLIVTQAALNVGLPNFTGYVILGDDIVIASSDVTTEYRKLMALLGMEISKTKSVTPYQGQKVGAEFCSRLVMNGEELTGLPVNAIVEVINNGDGLVSLWEVLHKRKLFLGQKIWEFMAIFVQPRDLQFLMLLNAIPQEVSGLNTVLQASDTPGVSPEAMEALGFTPQDVVNYYYFVLLSEVMSKIDAAVKRTLSIMAVLDTEVKTRPDGQELFALGTVQSLSVLVNMQARKLPSELGLIHPIQGVVKAVGRKVLTILSLFAGSGIDYKSLLSSPLLSVLNFSLDKKAAYGMKSESPFGDRRVLEKAMRLLEKSLNATGSKNISFTGRIDGVTQLWLISVTPGQKLVVVPHVPKLQPFLSGKSPGLIVSKKSVGFGFSKKNTAAT